MKPLLFILGVLLVVASVQGMTKTESGGLQIFPTDSIFNTPINNTTIFPTHAQSTTWMNAQMWTNTESGGLGTGPGGLYPAFSSTYGIPINIVNNTITNKTTQFTAYGQYSDFCYGCGASGYSSWGYPVPFPFYTQPGAGDRHAVLINKDRGLLYEIGGYDQLDSVPFAGNIRIGSIYNLSSNQLRGTWPGTPANIEMDGHSYSLPRSGGNGVGGVSVTALLITPGELQAGHIDHAMYMTVPWAQTSTYIWPARASYNPNCPGGTHNGYTCPSYGARVRLKDSVDLSSYQSAHPQAYTILKGMKDYGAIILDNSYLPWLESEHNRGFQLWGAGSVYIDGVKVSDIATNSNTDIQSIRSILCSASNFEYIDESGVMINANSAQANVTGAEPVTVTPVAAFSGTPLSGDAPLTVQFYDSSSYAPTAWNWSFGDGSYSDSADPSHAYTSAGTYTVVLNASNEAGYDLETKTGYITVTVAPLTPGAGVKIIYPTDDGDVYRLVNTNETAEDITTINSGVGTGIGTDPNDFGIFTRASYDPTNETFRSLHRLLYSFDLSSIPMDSTVTAVQFSVMGNTKANGLGGTPELVLTNATPATWNVLNYTDYNQTGTFTLAPNIAYADYSGTGRNTWTFDTDGIARVQERLGGHISVMVRFKDDYDGAFTGTYANYSYTYFGSYSSKATGTSNDPYLQVNYTNTDPWAGYVPDALTGVAPLTVNFTDISYNTPTGWNWSFQDKAGGGNDTLVTFSTDENPSHVFDAGNFLIRLNVSNAYGENVTPDVAWINVSAVGAPVANFTASKTLFLFPGKLTVTDTSTNTPTSWLWVWGDGTANVTTQNATHVYSKRGTWNLSLTATNDEGSDTKYQPITVMRFYQGAVPGMEENPLMVSCEAGTYTISREITEMERQEVEDRLGVICL